MPGSQCQLFLSQCTLLSPGCAHAVASVWLLFPFLCSLKSYHSSQPSSSNTRTGCLPWFSQSKEPIPWSLFPYHIIYGQYNKCNTCNIQPVFLTLEGHLLLAGYEIKVIGGYQHKKKWNRVEKIRKCQSTWHDFWFCIYNIHLCVFVCLCVCTHVHVCIGHNIKLVSY